MHAKSLFGLWICDIVGVAEAQVAPWSFFGLNRDALPTIRPQPTIPTISSDVSQERIPGSLITGWANTPDSKVATVSPPDTNLYDRLYPDTTTTTTAVFTTPMPLLYGAVAINNIYSIGVDQYPSLGPPRTTIPTSIPRVSITLTPSSQTSISLTNEQVVPTTLSNVLSPATKESQEEFTGLGTTFVEESLADEITTTLDYLPAPVASMESRVTEMSTVVAPGETRLDRLYAASENYSSGFLPLAYFDEGTSTTTAALELDRTDYHPTTYQLDEFVRQPARPLSPYVQKPGEVNIYCYPFSEAEILGKCKEGMDSLEATGVMIPMMNEMQTPKTEMYYEYVKKLRQAKAYNGNTYKIYGVAYDNPQWDLIAQILLDHDKLFDGIVLEWVGAKACAWNIRGPTPSHVKIIADRAGLPLNYFARQQDCDAYLLRKSGNGGSFFNPNDSVDSTDLSVAKGEWPKFLRYIFPCFQGEEGPCYNAIRNRPDKVCSPELQKFAYSPYEPLGGLMMYLKNETCHGLQDHDLYSVV